MKETGSLRNERTLERGDGAWGEALRSEKSVLGSTCAVVVELSFRSGLREELLLLVLLKPPTGLLSVLCVGALPEGLALVLILVLGLVLVLGGRMGTAMFCMQMAQSNILYPVL